MAESSGQEYAGFWARVVASILDQAFLVLFGAALGIAGGFAGPMAFAGSQAVAALVMIFYWPVMESSARQATFGKQMMGLQVTGGDGGRLSFLRAFARNLAKIISSIPLGIGFLMAAFTGRKQALHDMIAGSLVVRQGPSHFFKALVAGVGGLVLAGAGAWALVNYVILPQAASQMNTAMNDAMKGAMKGAAIQSAPRPAAAPPASNATTPLPTQLPSQPAVPKQPGPGAIQSAAVTSGAAPAAAKPAPSAPAAANKGATPQAPKPAGSEAAAKQPAAAETARETAPRPRPRRTVERRPLAAAPPPPWQAPGQQPPVFSPRYNDVMTAVMQRDRQTVTELLNHGWRPDSRADNGMTPLMGAVVMRDASMALLLLSRGADPNASGPGGMTALSLARERSDTAMAAVLQKAGAAR